MSVSFVSYLGISLGSISKPLGALLHSPSLKGSKNCGKGVIFFKLEPPNFGKPGPAG